MSRKWTYEIGYGYESILRDGVMVNKEQVVRALNNYESRIAELEAAQRWIPVSEPPTRYRDERGEFIPFLVCEGDKDYPYRALYDGTNWGDGMFIADVTHWMPLPKLPERENER